MYCLDSNIIIELFKGNQDIKEHISDLQDSNKEIFINPIILSELYKGVYTTNKKEIILKFLEDFTDKYTVKT